MEEGEKRPYNPLEDPPYRWHGSSTYLPRPLRNGLYKVHVRSCDRSGSRSFTDDDYIKTLNSPDFQERRSNLVVTDPLEEALIDVELAGPMNGIETKVRDY